MPRDTTVNDVGGAHIYLALVRKHGKKEADLMMRELWQRVELQTIRELNKCNR